MEISYNISLNELINLEKLCFGESAYKPKQLEDILKDKELYKVITVVEKEAFLGYVIIFNNSESIEIMKIATLPEFREKGIGRLLIQEILKYKMGIFLEVRENNKIARNFYLKCGFEEVGKRKNYYSDTKEAAIIMQKNI